MGDLRENAKQLNEKMQQLLLAVSAKLQQSPRSEHMGWVRKNAPTVSQAVMKALDNLYNGRLSPGSKIIYRMDGSIEVSTHLLEMDIGKNLCVDSFGPVDRLVLSEKIPSIARAIKIIDSLISYCQATDAYELRSRIMYWLNRALYRNQVRCAVAKAVVKLKASGQYCQVEHSDTYTCIATSIGAKKLPYTSTGYRQSKLLVVSPFRTLSASNHVAKTILHQLGGNKFIVMTGAKMLVHGDNWLSFRVGKNSGGWNYVKITLTPDDLYDMEFATLTKLGDVKKKKVIKDLYADQLRNAFTDNTGMYTHL